MVKYLDYDGLLEFKNQLDNSLDDKVDKITGKGLSTNDFTTDLKNKLDNIEAGATANEGTVTGITIGQTDYIPINGLITLPDYLTTFGASGSNHASGLVPDPGSILGNTKYLREDGTWGTPPDTTYSTMGASGSTHAGGLVPDTPSTAGTTKYLREDGTWAEPSGGGGTLDFTEEQTQLEDLDATLVANALRKTAQVLSAAEKAQVKENIGIANIGDGGTATGIMVAQSNTSYTTAQIRNIILSTEEPTSADGNNGDIWIVYESE